MSFSEELTRHAIRLLGNAGDSHVTEVDLRRAVSSAYYALFHHLARAAAMQIAPDITGDTSFRIQRWLEHAEMKKVCGKFLSEKLEKPLRELIGPEASSDLQTVAISFVRLQDARHSADYDLAFRLTWEEALEFVTMAVRAIGAWQRIAQTPEANVFILSLLLWKNWERDRP